MKIRATMHPGQKGTRNLQEKYGDRLVCVRYRYGNDGARYTTVELIEAEKLPIKPRYKHSDMVGLRIEYWESELRNKVKQAGGIWRPKQKIWELSYGDATNLELKERIVTD